MPGRVWRHQNTNSTGCQLQPCDLSSKCCQAIWYTVLFIIKIMRWLFSNFRVVYKYIIGDTYWILKISSGTCSFYFHTQRVNMALLVFGRNVGRNRYIVGATHLTSCINKRDATCGKINNRFFFFWEAFDRSDAVFLFEACLKSVFSEIKTLTFDVTWTHMQQYIIYNTVYFLKVHTRYCFPENSFYIKKKTVLL